MTASTLQFRFRSFVVSSLVVAGVLLSIVAIPQWFSRQARLDVLRSHVGQIAKLAASVVDGDLHRELLTRSGYSPERYAAALQPLVKFHSANNEIFYVYTMVAIGTDTFFVLDTANSPQLRSTHELRASEYMEPFKLRSEYEGDWLQQLAAGNTWVTPNFQHDDYGYFLTGHSPIRDSSGQMAGFVGVDFNLEYYLAEEARFRRIEIASLAAALLMSLLLGYLFARNQYGLKKQVRLHYESSMQDELTSLLNRRGVLQAVSGALAMPSATTHATLLVDIDHFKSINDNYGHAAGDAVIARLASALRQCIRSGDIASRLGGDEFLILAPNCDLAGAEQLADRLLACVRAPDAEQLPPYTISIGISVEAHLGADFDAMYRRADAALYRAKADGKNRYVVCVNAVTEATP